MTVFQLGLGTAGCWVHRCPRVLSLRYHHTVVCVYVYICIYIYMCFLLNPFTFFRLARHDPEIPLPNYTPNRSAHKFSKDLYNNVNRYNID